MDDFENSKSHILMSLKLLKIHKRAYLGRVNGGLLLDNFVSLKLGLKFLEKFLEVSTNMNLIQRIGYLVSNVKQKLYSLRYLGTVETVVMNLDHAYAELRDLLENVIIKPGTSEYDVILPEMFTYGNDYSETSDFICGKIKKLVSSHCKADLITPIMKELEGIRKMLKSLLAPFFRYAEVVNDRFDEKEEENKIFSIITTVLDRVACFVYASIIKKLDAGMVLSLKNSLSDLMIVETQIMKMYLILDIDSIENLEFHVCMSLRFLELNKKCYFSTEMGAALEDDFMSIKHGFQFLDRILKLSKGTGLKRSIQHLVSIVKEKLYSLSHDQEDETLILNLKHGYGALREEMQNVVIKPLTNEYVTLFPKNLRESYKFSSTKEFLLKKIRILVTSSCKADQIAPIKEELEELRKKLASLKPLFDYVLLGSVSRPLEKEVKEIFVGLTTFLDKATCLVYLSFVGKLNEGMLVSLRKTLSFLIEETGLKEMSLVLGIHSEDDLKSDIDTSLSLLKRQEEYYTGTVNEVALKDNIISLKHGIEFLKWIHTIYKGRDLERSIILLAGNVKQKLEMLAYKQGNESLNMDVNGAYDDLREEMKNVIMNKSTDKYDILFPDFNMISFVRGDTDFLIEKITTLLESNCRIDQIAPLKKELQHLRNILASLKPLDLYNSGLYRRVSTIYHKSTLLIYLSFVGRMDIRMVLSIKSNISTAMNEIEVGDIYTMILNEMLHNINYLEEDLYLLENLILLLKGNVEYFNDASCKLYEVLIDVHIFLIGLSPNKILRKLHILQPSFQDIVRHSVPIICSCYVEHAEVEISVEWSCVLDLVKHIMFEAQEIKLYYFPRVDDLGFLEFFVGYVVDLMENQDISMKEEIDALHFEVHSLLSLARVTNQKEFNGTPWTNIINMAYQAEYIIDLYLVSSPRDLGLISSLSKIIEQLKKIRTDVHGLCSRSLTGKDAAVVSKPQNLGTTTQFSGKYAIVGLQEETRIITEYLLKGENKLDVISIVGMAGVGKTTLSLALYKTPSIAHHFDILAWCTVSQSYQNRELLLSIVDQVKTFDQNQISILDDEELADHLCRSLKKRRYLIVLDDIWDTMLWDYLKRYLPDDRTGSRILISTRNWDVANEIGSKVNKLHQLSEENSWELFLKMISEKESLSVDLLRISRGIVEHCKGLPLSIVIIAGILSDVERTKKKWNQIEESVTSLVLSDPQRKCKAIIELSYNHLHNHLRSCFLYLASFPEDQEISVNQLKNLWIGEGLVRDTKSDRAEDVAKRYMNDLIVKCLVVPAKENSRGEVKAVQLHDLLRDFCVDKAEEKHFFMMLDKRNYSQPLKDPRRLIINGPHTDRLHFSCHSLRSVICYDKLEASVVQNGIQSYDMVLLQVLRVGEVSSNTFLNISNLVHLRYLELRLPGWRHFMLPSSISKLQNLQILILSIDCVEIEVPDLIWDMRKLRHLDLSPKAAFHVDNNRLQNSPILLENLRYLSNARISHRDSQWLSKLSGMKRLCCDFEDDYLEDYEVDYEEADYVEDYEVNDYEEADYVEDYEVNDYEVGDDEEDEYLEIFEGDDDDNDREEDEFDDDDREEDEFDDDDREEDGGDHLEANQFQMLRFNSHLSSLKVRNGGDPKKRFISTCQFPIDLQELSLSFFFLTSNDFSDIGRAVPHLEVFKIYGCSVPFEFEWNVDDEDFPGLKVLKLRDLNISKWVASENSFPSLEQLWLEDCGNLDKIPLDFGYLPKLHLISLIKCASSVEDSAREIEKLQHEDQNIEMRVHINYKDSYREAKRKKRDALYKGFFGD